MPVRPTHFTPHLLRPDLTPFAGVLLTLSFFFVLIYHPADPRPGLVPLHKTPRIGCQSCFSVPDHTRLLVCLTADSRLSFTASNASLQLAALKMATCSPSQPTLTEAQVLTCITTARVLSPDMTQLPACLYLVIDADTNSSAVMHLLKLLQQYHISRLFLVAHCH